MSTIVYVAVVEGSEKDGYSAFFPDLPGCVTASNTMLELLADARDALSLHLEGMLEDGIPLPTPATLENIPRDADVVEVGRILIDAEIDDSPVRVNISIGAQLLRRVDIAAQIRGMTRSGFMIEATRKFMAQPAPPERTNTGPVAAREPAAGTFQLDYLSSQTRYLIVPTADDNLAVIWDRLEEAVIDVIQVEPHATRTFDYEGKVIQFPDPAALELKRA